MQRVVSLPSRKTANRADPETLYGFTILESSVGVKQMHIVVLALALCNTVHLTVGLL